MQVCGGQMGEKEKQNNLSIMKGGGIACCEWPALSPESMEKYWPTPLLKVMCGFVVIQQQG